MVVHAKAYGCAFGNSIKVVFIDFQFCIILLHLSLKFYELVITCSFFFKLDIITIFDPHV